MPPPEFIATLAALIKSTSANRHATKKIPLSLGQVASGRPQRWERKQKKKTMQTDSQSCVDVPVAFNRVVVDLGQAVARSHHNLVQFWVP